MELFELFATLGLDTSKFTSGLTGALQWALGQVWDFAKDVVETGMGFDEQMSAVQAVLGSVEGTEEHMAELRRIGLQEARESIFTSEEVAKAYYYMGMAGWKTEEMLAGLPAILDLAAASGEPLARVSDIVTDSLTAFGLSAGDAQHYVDILAQTATNSNTDVRRMGETFKYVAPIAGALGYSVDDVALSIGLLASAGIKGSMAGTTLRNIFTRISTNAGETTKDLGALTIITEKLGVDFFDAQGNARDWGEVLMELREAWAGMDEFSKLGIISEFNSAIESGADAEATLKEFLADEQTVSNLTKQLASAQGDEYDALANQIVEFGGQYNELLNLLGIPIPNTAEGYADALEKARLALGELSDADKIYYAKQIASMRGMSGFLALLEAEEKDVKQLTEAYENAVGAAEAMAGIRLDNLGGDVKLFKASLDVLKIAIYDDVDGPLREIVKFGSGALNRITDAINEKGLTGGIEQLGVEIEGLAKMITPILHSLGTALAPIVSSMLGSLMDTSGPAIVKIAVELGRSIVRGIAQGIYEDYPVLATILGIDHRTLGLMDPSLTKGEWIKQFFLGKEGVDAANNIAYKFALPSLLNPLGNTLQTEYKNYGGVEIPVDLIANIDAQELSDNIQDAIEHGEQVDIGEGFILDPRSAYVLIRDMAEAGDEGAQAIFGDLTEKLGEAGLNVGLALELGAAGDPAGDTIVSSIQGKLSSANFSINVKANIVGYGGGGRAGGNYGHADMYAKGMADGYILNRATVFGMNNNGVPMVGGEAGPEAVVGVNSLNNMIQNSVNSAVASVLGKLDRIISNQGHPVPAVVDAESLSDGLSPYMDRAFGARYEYSGRGNA